MQNKLFTLLLCGLLLSACSTTNKKELNNIVGKLDFSSSYRFDNSDIDLAYAKLKNHISKSDQVIVLEVDIVKNLSNAKEVPSEYSLLVNHYLSKLIQNKKFLSCISCKKGNRRLIGALTTFDVVQTDNDTTRLLGLFGKGRGETDIDYANTTNLEIAKAGLTLSITTFNETGSGFQISDLSVSNQIDVNKHVKKNKYSFVVYGNGISVNGTLKKNLGTQSIVQTLIAYSVFELISKLYKFDWENAMDEIRLKSIKTPIHTG